MTIRQYIDEKTAEKGGKIIITAGNGKQIEVAVPPKWKDGMKLRLRECGKPGKNGGEPGDTYLEPLILKPKKESGKKKTGTQKRTMRKKSVRKQRDSVDSDRDHCGSESCDSGSVPCSSAAGCYCYRNGTGALFLSEKTEKCGRIPVSGRFLFNGAIMSVGTTIIVGFIHMGLMFPVAKLLGKARKS